MEYDDNAVAPRRKRTLAGRNGVTPAGAHLLLLFQLLLSSVTPFRFRSAQVLLLCNLHLMCAGMMHSTGRVCRWLYTALTVLCNGFGVCGNKLHWKICLVFLCSNPLPFVTPCSISVGLMQHTDIALRVAGIQFEKSYLCILPLNKETLKLPAESRRAAVLPAVTTKCTRG